MFKLLDTVSVGLVDFLKVFSHLFDLLNKIRGFRGILILPELVFVLIGLRSHFQTERFIFNVC